jgi:hypothetical protein
MLRRCFAMKKEPLKIISIIKNTDKSALQKAVTEKISRIINAELVKI